MTLSYSFNLLAQKHDRVTCATKQIERDSKDTDATNSYPEKVQIKLVCNTLQKQRKVYSYNGTFKSIQRREIHT